jgi:hypothetical protein
MITINFILTDSLEDPDDISMRTIDIQLLECVDPRVYMEKLEEMIILKLSRDSGLIEELPNHGIAVEDFTLSD